MAERPKDFYNLGMSFRTLILTVLLLIPGLAIPSLARAEFGFHAGSHFGIGKMAYDNGIPGDRDMGTFDLQFMPGYRFPMGLMAGLMLDYRLMSQLTDESETGRTDYSGRSLLMGLAATFEPGPLKFLLGWDLRARHWFSGPDTTFMGSGWRLLFGYKFLPGFAFDIEFVNTIYNASEVNGLETGLNNNNLKHWNLGFGVSYSY